MRWWVSEFSMGWLWIFWSAPSTVLLEFTRAWSRDEVDGSLRITQSNRAVQRDARFKTDFAILLVMYIHDGTAAFHLRKIFKIIYSFICKRPGCWIHAASLIETIPKPWTMSKGASQVRRAQFLWRHTLHWAFFNSQRNISSVAWPGGTSGKANKH